MKPALVHLTGDWLHIASSGNAVHIPHYSLAALAERKVDEKLRCIGICRFGGETDSIHLRENWIEGVDPVNGSSLFLHEFYSVVESPSQRTFPGRHKTRDETMPVPPRWLLSRELMHVVVGSFLAPYRHQGAVPVIVGGLHHHFALPFLVEEIIVVFWNIPLGDKACVVHQHQICDAYSRP